VGHANELSAPGVGAQKVQEAADVEVVKRRLDLVEDVERTRPGEEDGEQESDGGHRLLAAGEQRQALHRLARGGDLDLDPEQLLLLLGELRPAGKRVTRLSLLSGGEKSLGAIAFLFALFLARPCPFYLLDEVEAALDDTNIGRFVELLRRYSDRAQFIVITHQKRTMEAADVLYGVTMGPDGVSQIVSRRLPHQDEAAAIA
jgi:chromosome segregation protein